MDVENRLERMARRIDELQAQMDANHSEALDHAENMFAAVMKMFLFTPEVKPPYFPSMVFNDQEAFCLARLGFKRLTPRTRWSVVLRREGHDDIIVTGPHKGQWTLKICRTPMGPRDELFYPNFKDLLIDLVAIMDLAG